MRILLVESQINVRFAVQVLLNQQANLQVVGEAADGSQAVQLAEQLKPDLVVMDIAIPGLDGFEAARQIKSRQLTRYVVLLTTQSDSDTRARAAEVAADAFVDKSAGSEILLATIREAYAKLFPNEMRSD